MGKFMSVPYNTVTSTDNIYSKSHYIYQIPQHTTTITHTHILNSATTPNSLDTPFVVYEHRS